jgi:hypothetical protein
MTFEVTPACAPRALSEAQPAEDNLRNDLVIAHKAIGNLRATLVFLAERLGPILTQPQTVSGMTYSGIPLDAALSATRQSVQDLSSCIRLCQDFTDGLISRAEV